jgi:hypothetical protein
VSAGPSHEERRLLDHVVADVDDAVGILDRAVDEIAGRQRRAAEEQGWRSSITPLPIWVVRNGMPVLSTNWRSILPGHLAVGARADHQHRALAFSIAFDRLAHRLGSARRRRASSGSAANRCARRRCPRAARGGPRRAFPPRPGGRPRARGWDVVGAASWWVYLVIGPIIVDHVEDLEAALLRFLDRLLAGDHQHRHAAELGIGGGGDEVGRARPQRGQAHAGLAGVAAIGRGHEAGALFVAGEDQLDLARARQRIEEIEVLLARHAEDVFAAFLLKALMNRSDAFCLPACVIS